MKTVHDRDCRAYGNYQPPYEDCTCGAECRVTPVSSRICDRGTKGCVVMHANQDIEATVGGMDRPGAETTTVVNSEKEVMRRVLIGTASLGLVRIEWASAVGGMVIPCNWSNSSSHVLGFLVADAQNVLVQQTLRDNFRYLLLLEDDVLPGANLFLQLEKHMEAGVPIVSGLYRVKGNSDPMIYRGRGNGPYKQWKPGDQVWADGVPTGCLLIHHKILQALWDVSPEYDLHPIGGSIRLRKVFHTPRWAHTDMGSGNYQKMMGTSDLQFCADVVEKDIFKKAGFPEYARKKYPFLVDTSMNCGHIDRNTGQVW